MKISFDHRLGWAALGAAALAGAFVAVTRIEAKVDPRTYDLKKKILGKSAGQWTAEWWQWAYSTPMSVNPIIDTTGKYVEVGQYGPVWFLGGTFASSGAADRTATIPSGTALLCAVNNVEWDALDPTTPTFAQMKTAAAKYIDGLEPSTFVATVDGVPVSGLSKMRIVSPAFEYTVPDDGVYAYTGQNFPGGIYKPAVSDGYWVFLKPLAIGNHVLHFEAGGQVITYRLAVVDHDRP